MPDARCTCPCSAAAAAQQPPAAHLKHSSGSPELSSARKGCCTFTHACSSGSPAAPNRHKKQLPSDNRVTGVHRHLFSAPSVYAAGTMRHAAACAAAPSTMHNVAKRIAPATLRISRQQLHVSTSFEVCLLKMVHPSTPASTCLGLPGAPAAGARSTCWPQSVACPRAPLHQASSQHCACVQQ